MTADTSLTRGTTWVLQTRFDLRSGLVISTGPDRFAELMDQANFRTVWIRLFACGGLSNKAVTMLACPSINIDINRARSYGPKTSSKTAIDANSALSSRHTKSL